MQKCKSNLKRQNNIKQTINKYNTRYKNRKRSKRSKRNKNNKQVAAVSYWSFKS